MQGGVVEHYRPYTAELPFLTEIDSVKSKLTTGICDIIF